MQVTFDIPNQQDLSERDIKILFAGMLHKNGIMSLGNAAKTAGMEKREFMNIMGNYGFSVFNYPADDLQKELDTLSCLDEHRNNHRH